MVKIGNPSKHTTLCECRAKVGYKSIRIFAIFIVEVLIDQIKLIGKLEFRDKLIKARIEKGITQEELAEKSNINVRTIQRIESGAVQPRVHTVKVISSALGIDFVNPTLAKKLPINLWYIKDLFNLKTQTMKKITILGSLLLVFVLGINFFVLGEENSKGKKPYGQGITIQYDSEKNIKRIDVEYSNKLTFDSLVYIKNTLKEHGITLIYKSIEFDEKGGLSGLECDVDCNDGISGGFQLDSISGDKWTGFFRDYSEDTEVAFCSGSCTEKKS